MIRVDVYSLNGDRISEPQETGVYSGFPGNWWPADPGAVVEVMVDVRPEVLALYPQLPRTLRVRLTGLSDSPRPVV